MTAFNAVRFKVKPGREQEFLDAHRNVHAEWPGLRHVNMIKTLNSFRDTLEDLGGGLGVTDPVGGPVVLALK